MKFRPETTGHYGETMPITLLSKRSRRTSHLLTFRRSLRRCLPSPESAAGGKHVTPKDIAAARAQGATDCEIQDTVLIAAAFCMFNRHVDGLATWQPEDPADYRLMGKMMAPGYTRTDWEGDSAPAETLERS